MARLPLTGAEAVELVHTAPVGTSVQGYTLTSRTQNGDGTHHWTVTVTKASNTWTCEYLVHDVAPYGKIVKIVDEDGHRWYRDPTTGDWVDNGVVT